MLALLLALAAVNPPPPDACDDWLDSLRTVRDSSDADLPVRPWLWCQQLIDQGSVDVDAVIRALPVPAQARVACRIGSTALDDLRLAAVDDLVLSTRDRGRCLAVLLERDFGVVAGRAFVPDPDHPQRTRVAPVVVEALADYADARDVFVAPEERTRRRALFVPILEQAVRDRVVGRWSLGAALCPAPIAPSLSAACDAVAADHARAVADVEGAVVVEGVAWTSLLAGLGGALYLVPALLAGDGAFAIPFGVVGGAFFGALVAVAPAVGLGALASAEAPASNAGPGVIGAVVGVVADIVVALVVIVITIAAVVATGAVVGGIVGGVVAASPGDARVAVDVAGAVGVVGSVLVVGGLATWIAVDDVEVVE